MLGLYRYDKLEAGSSTPFAVRIPVREQGHQFQVSVGIFDKPEGFAATTIVTSEPTQIPSQRQHLQTGTLIA